MYELLLDLGSNNAKCKVAIICYLHFKAKNKVTYLPDKHQ